MDGREMNAEQRRFITDTESTNSHESPHADLRWTESLSHPLCIATGRSCASCHRGAHFDARLLASGRMVASHTDGGAHRMAHRIR